MTLETFLEPDQTGNCEDCGQMLATVEWQGSMLCRHCAQDAANEWSSEDPADIMADRLVDSDPHDVEPPQF